METSLPALDEDAPDEDPDQTDRVIDDHDGVEDDVNEADSDQDPADKPTDRGRHKVAEAEKEQADDVNGALVKDMLEVDDAFLPLPLSQGKGQHSQAAQHDHEDAVVHYFIHENDDKGVNDSAQEEHQGVNDGHIPFVVVLQAKE